MEGFAEALIPHPQKPCSALITEDAEEFACLHFGKACLLFENYYRRQMLKRLYVITQPPPIIEMEVWWKLDYAHRVCLRSSCPLGNLFLPVKRHPKPIFTSSCFTVK